MKKLLLPLFLILATNILFAENKQNAYEYFTIASYEASQDNYQVALEYYKKFLELEPNNLDAQKDILEISISLKNPEIASPYVDNVIKKLPEDAKVWGLYGGYQWLLGDVDKAQNAYQKSIDLGSDDPAILYQYIMLLSVEDSAEIIKYLAKYAELYPNSAPLLYNEIGKMEITKENYETALLLFQKAKELDKYNYNSYLNAMTVYLLEDKQQSFIKEAIILENLGYKEPKFFGEVGAFYLKQNNEKKAFEYFEKALALDKNSIEVNEFLSLYYRKEKNYEKSIHYATSRADFQTNPMLWVSVTYINFEAGKPEEARKYLETAYEKFPENKDVVYFYATDLYETDPYKSYKILKDFLKEDSTSQSARRQFVYSAEKIGKYSDMEKTIAELLQEDPNNHRLLNFLAYSYSKRGIKLDTAEELSTKALSYDEHEYTFAYKDTLGWVYYKQGKYEDAKDEFVSSLNMGGKDTAEIWEHLGFVFYDMGEYTQSYL
ncbi:MAG: tetratricopeptide repeat protein, partial [Elusimicrobiaceae bacterium]|nr:tetratricopeptide repeat protein [Elusimicrobiaceae bacterium]